MNKLGKAGFLKVSLLNIDYLDSNYLSVCIVYGERKSH